MSINKGKKKNETKKKRSVLNSQSREMIVNLRSYFEAEKIKGSPLIPIDQVIARTAAACNISEKDFYYITSEKKTKKCDYAKLYSTERFRPRDSLINSCREDAIRRHIYAYYEREEYPTMRRLVASLSQAELFQGNTKTLRYILKNLGFSWKKNRGNRKLLTERVHFQAWRGRFIRDILAVPVERIIWLDETCVSSDHFKRQRSVETAQETKNASKGFRLILLNAGGIEGFVPNAKFMFRGKRNSNDYHNDISQDTFNRWFTEQLIPNLKPERIIIMDDAPYHCVQKEKYPTRAQTKDEIMAWLESRNIKFDPTMFKSELLEIVKQQNPQYPIYEIDEIAKERGHRVLRIPPYHSHFNPLEIIWTQTKDYVTENMKSFKVLEATKLTEEKMNNISPQDWEIAVKHTMEVITAQAELYKILEEKIETMIHTPNSTSETEESDYTDEEFSGDEEMLMEVEYSPPEG